MPHPTADQLTDAALPGVPTDPEVAAHLTTCARCTAEVDGLRRTVGRARDAMALDAAPPPRPEVWEGVLARLGPDAPDAPDVPDAGAVREPVGAAQSWPAAGGRRPGSRGRRLVGAGVAALVAAAAVVAAVVVTTPPDRPAPPAPVAVALVAARPGVTAEVVDGPDTMHVDVVLAQPVPPGTDLEVWDMSASTPRSLGTLRPLDGRVHWTGDLPRPPEGGMPPLDVSLEPVGSDPGHSGVSLAHTA
ncbi:anti-sigma factor [Actinomycetospora lemnae]|uniref:Anti-sigma factor n=1 Tax=Actinomycetospora lemnae TaxID=3019891 RepID=A0ABT5SYS0_9PSEU|nr:anti-sigma factor [Actinomycetospora sp. DW7H6]MDD7968007.1 anti-sigma factor [Actinomycetospora sp. DW7H6]